MEDYGIYIYIYKYPSTLIYSNLFANILAISKSIWSYPLFNSTLRHISILLKLQPALSPTPLHHPQVETFLVRTPEACFGSGHDASRSLWGDSHKWIHKNWLSNVAGGSIPKCHPIWHVLDLRIVSKYIKIYQTFLRLSFWIVHARAT